MSHFYGNMQGNKGETTRCGSKSSGIKCHIRGWNVGAKVYVQHKNGKDMIIVYKTGGSKCEMRMQLICAFTEDGQL